MFTPFLMTTATLLIWFCVRNTNCFLPVMGHSLVWRSYQKNIIM